MRYLIGIADKAATIWIQIDSCVFVLAVEFVVKEQRVIMDGCYRE